jgi:hypothetical protein
MELEELSIEELRKLLKSQVCNLSEAACRAILAELNNVAENRAS